METKDLGAIDKLLIENLALTEENAKLRAKISDFQIMEKRIAIRNHLASKFKIDLANFDFEVDSKDNKLKIVPKNEKTPV